MDELNHDFQALALEGRVMGEVRVHITNFYLVTHFLFFTSYLKSFFFFFFICCSHSSSSQEKNSGSLMIRGRMDQRGSFLTSGETVPGEPLVIAVYSYIKLHMYVC